MVRIVVFSVGGKDEGREQLGLKGAVNSPDTTWLCLLPHRLLGHLFSLLVCVSIISTISSTLWRSTTWLWLE